MIKIVVTNMSCGHCQLKINAELESNNYKVIKIDMDENTVLIDSTSNEVYKIKKILDKINYVVDDQYPIFDIVEFTIWDDKLEDETNYNLLTDYFVNRGINVVGFNDEDFGIIILCTETQLEETVKYINEL